MVSGEDEQSTGQPLNGSLREAEEHGGELAKEFAEEIEEEVEDAIHDFIEENEDEVQAIRGLADEIEEIENEVEETVQGITTDFEGVFREVAGLLREMADEEEERVPVLIEDLRNLLPDEIDGLYQVLVDSRSTFPGLGVSDVRATYGDDEIEFTLFIIDSGSLAPLVREFTEWLGEDIDHESDRGFERTRIYRPRATDFPSLENFTRTNSHAECTIMIWVSDRFLVGVEASGLDVEMADCVEARDELSFRKLERLARSQERE